MKLKKSLLEDLLFQRERKGERGREKHQCERETLNGCVPYAPDWGKEPGPRYVP